MRIDSTSPRIEMTDEVIAECEDIDKNRIRFIEKTIPDRSKTNKRKKIEEPARSVSRRKADHRKLISNFNFRLILLTSI